MLHQQTNQGSKASSAAKAEPVGQTQEFSVRIPKLAGNKKYSVMRFNGSDGVSVAAWNQIHMCRENNLKQFKTDEDMPKFGAGSEYGRERREEARRKKYGIISKKYNPEDQPWLLKVGGKNGKRYKGTREGGIGSSSSYYMFKQASDGAFEAFPLDAWYNFTSLARYKTLNEEEAEEEFGRRDKILNHFSIMVKKRLKPEGGGVVSEEAEETTNKKTSKADSLRITDHDEWADSDEENDDDVDDDDTPKEEKKLKKEKVTKEEKNRKNRDVNEEAVEESDEGDYDDVEIDYISESDSSVEELEEDKKTYKDEMKGVEDQWDEAEEDEEDENEESKDSQKKDSESPDKDKKYEQKNDVSSSSGDSDTSDSDIDDTNITSSLFLQKKKGSSRNSPSSSATNSRPNTPQISNDPQKTLNEAAKKLLEKGKKRPISTAASEIPAKKARTASPVHAANEGITEDAVKRYLMRKPMTTKDLLQKFKNKCKGMSSQQMVNTLTLILKKLNPERTIVKDKGQQKMTLFIKKND